MSSQKMQKGFAFTKLADRLASVAELSDADVELLSDMPFTIDHFASRDRLIRRPDRPTRCCLLLQGYLCWRDDNDGQITSIYVPGDIPDLHTIVEPQLDAHLTALGPVVVAWTPHAFFRKISSQSSSLDHALKLLGIADTARMRNWIINLGTRDSLTRVAHLICEITVRLRAVGLAKDDHFPSPFTQLDLGSACAISAVHVNRVIQELRRREVLLWQSRTITIIDWQALCRIACFEPHYLRLGDSGSSARHRPQFSPSVGTPDLSIFR
jgi:CRP-like cAMP-binding protein